jgi:hypothetical protein
MARAAAHHAETKRSTATVDGSHSARLVKPTITVSGQYLEWTASRALVVDGERAVVREDQRYQRAGDHEADLPVPGGAGTRGSGYAAEWVGRKKTDRLAPEEPIQPSR